MNTTLLFAEILIIGLQAGVWLFFLVLSFFGYEWLQSIQTTGLSDWGTLIGVVIVSFFYVLGIILDRWADRLFGKREKRIRDSIFPDPPEFISTMRFEISKDNEPLSRQFDYTRSRMRIARASSLNFGLTTVFVMVFIIIRLQQIEFAKRIIPLLFVLLIGSFLTVSAIYTWNKLTARFYKLVRINYDLREPMEKRSG